MPRILTDTESVAWDISTQERAKANVIFASPTGTIGLTASNGSAKTAMRSDASPALSQAIAPTWTGQHTFGTGGGLGFSSNKAVSATQTESEAWLWTPQSPGNTWSGAVTGTDALGGVPSAYALGVRFDTLDTSGHLGYAFGLNYVHVVQANHKGGRVGIASNLTVQSAPAASGALDIYTGLQSTATVNANLNGTTGAIGNYKGAALGGDSDVILSASATFLSLVEAHEFGVKVPTGASAARKYGLNIVQRAADAVRGVYDDSAISIAKSDSAATTWLRGLSFGATPAAWPFATDSTLIAAVQRQYPSTGPTPTAKIGVDFSAVTFSEAFLKSTGFLVDPSGFIRWAASQGIKDDSGNPYLIFAKTASAVNYVTIQNRGTGAGPIIAAGGETDVQLLLSSKGSAALVLQTGGTNRLAVTSSTLQPSTNDSIALGTTTRGFADLHLASGAVINWANGTYTLTQNGSALEASGNLLNGGYLRVGSTSSPNNTTAGDLTSVRLSLGNVTLPGGQIAGVGGTLTDTSGSVSVARISATFNPSANNTGQLRGLTIDNIAQSANTFALIYGSAHSTDFRGSGSITQIYGLRGIAVTLNANAQNFGTITNACGAILQPVLSFGNTVTGAFTNTYGLQILDSAKGTSAFTIAGQAGLQINALSAATNNTAILIGTTTIPSGSYAIYSDTTNPSRIAGELRISGDTGGVASHTTFTGTSNVTANSTGTGTIKFKGTTSRDSSGFIKVYIGTTAYYVPVFSEITG